MKSASLKGERSFNNINVKTMTNQMRKQQVMNEMQTILSLFAFLEYSRNCTVPGEGYIRSERSPTGVTDTPTGRQSAPHSKKKKIVTGKYLRNLPAQYESLS